ncbi:hypothetical protein HPT25_12315 [Bacillus sp. BRMEA1]|uniref:hypothetical protein n=1 Tax=Neobacillus endophyticus TaxID=2738405 RepID=UPI001564D48C|nr:hypothetical protein [Neobacillus endophyticus]NRD78171.1 hypothetical protein [Neobacillus endophyticus]
MIKVKIKTKDRNLTVPVPYVFLNIFSAVLTSKRLIKIVNNAIEQKGKKDFKVPQIERKDIKLLLQALVKHKGLHLVETKLKDGTEVKVKL